MQIYLIYSFVVPSILDQKMFPVERQSQIKTQMSILIKSWCCDDSVVFELLKLDELTEIWKKFSLFHYKQR